MNLQQLRARTRQLAGAELDGLRSDDEMDDIIREAYQRIGYQTNWRWREDIKTFTTAADDDTYNVPTGIDQIQDVTITDDPGSNLPVPLSEVSLRDIRTRVDRDDTDAPRFYAKKGANEIILAPTPDAAYTVEVMGQAPLTGLTNDTDVPEFESRYHPAIAYLAASVFLYEEGQTELADLRRIRSDEIVGQMAEYYQVTHDDSPLVMGGGQRFARQDRLGRLWVNR